MKEYEESLRTLMELFREEVESGTSYRHIHKVIYDNLDNLNELINQQKEVKKVTKVEMVRSRSHVILESKINKFLNNESIELVDIKYDNSSLFTALIIYKLEDKP